MSDTDKPTGEQEQGEIRKTLENNAAQLGARLEEFRDKARRAQGDLKAEYEKRVAALERQRDDLRRGLEELRNSSGEAWHVLRDGVGKATREFKGSLDAAMAKFKE
jgi:chromosome segregation ATPase